ncbi:hypothetical protein INT43_008140 [Umbelopsis isabellina]|uniref:PH domain-containing protein n=1 Tax=Mortierella isabellina TaxID=91625 RepID=A0A8H7PDL4_MORIS|nr:hypothetical protein INT43_008140 [Umbelopsis isabellina]
MQSSDDDSDDMPVALSHQLRRTKQQGPPSQTDRRHLARAKTMNSSSTSRNQGNLTRSNTEHHRSRGHREERPVPESSRKVDDDNNDDSPVRGRGTERNDRGAIANKPGKIRTHDVRNIQADLHRLQLASVQKIASRIYVIDSSKYVNLQLTSLMTTAMVLESLRERAVIDQEQSWTLFELANKVGVERPLRDWEIVTDILSTWDQDEKNALLVKKYSYKPTLTPESVLGKNEFVPPSGHLYFEYKRGKWHKRSFTVKGNGIYLSRESKKTGDAPIVPLANVDVYTLTIPIKKAPTPFGFILKAQQKARIFENPEDFVFSFCAEDMEQLKLWVLGLRQNLAFYASNPARLLSPLKPLELPPLPQSVVHKVLSPSENTPLIDQQQLLNSDPEPKPIPSVSSEISKGSASKIHRSATLLERSMQTERIDDGNKVSVRRYKSTRDIKSSSRQAEPLVVGNDVETDYRRQPDMPPAKPIMLRPSKSLGTRRTANSSRHQDHSADVPRIGRSEDRRQLDKGNISATNERYSPIQPDDGSSLLKLNENFQFSDGSLLQQASDTVVPRGRSKSISRDPRRVRSQSRPRHASVSDNNEQGSSATRSKSLRRKPTVKGANDREPEAHPPLPKASGEDGPLLQLDLTPEASHTKALRDRQVKPLITF